MSLKKINKKNSKFNVVIFGGSSGLGKDISEQFNKKEYRLYIFGKKEIKKKNVQNHYYKKCDLSKFIDIKKSIEHIKKEIKTVDLLILNSGVLNFQKIIVQEKYENMFFINFLSQFIILYFLKKNICNSILKTIIIISSHVIFFNKLRLKDLQSLDNFNFWNSYKNSKYLLATMAYNLFVDYDKINFLLFNPGRIKSNLGYSKSFFGYLSKIYHLLFGIKTNIEAKNLYNVFIKLKKKKNFFLYYSKGNLINLKKKDKTFFSNSLFEKALDKLKNDKILIKKNINFF